MDLFGILFIVSESRRALYKSVCDSRHIISAAPSDSYKETLALPDKFCGVLVIDGLEPVDACLTLIERYSQRGMSFVVCGYDDSMLIRFVSIGACRFFTRKATPQTVRNAAVELTKSQGSGPNALYARISDILLCIGIPVKNSGFTYLRDCITAAVTNPKTLDNTLRGIYSSVAEKYGVKANAVERAIRHSIGGAFTTGKIGLLNRLFGVTFVLDTDKPTNNELIALIADRLLIEFS